MAISAVDAYSQALLAQQQGMSAFAFGGGAIGGTTVKKPESVNEAVKRVDLSTKFDWRSLNGLDGTLNGTASAAGLGKTTEIPTDSIFSIGTGAKAAGAQGTPSYNAQAELLATLNAIDARDIGLNSNKNGFQGQRHVNLLA